MVFCNALCKACVCATASCKASCKACVCATASCNALYKACTLGLHIMVSLKGRITCIWSFGCGFACATAMGCAGLKLLFGTIIILELLIIIKQTLGNKGLSQHWPIGWH